MPALEKLRKTTSLSELAIIIGYKPNALSYILYKIPNEKKYIEFTVPKKNGDKRKIKAPIDQLKDLQKRLAELLNGCFEEIDIQRKHKHSLSPGFKIEHPIKKNKSNKKNKVKKDKRNGSLSHGFRKNHSILSNAVNHENRRHVFNVDLQDFFPSINFGRVRGFFIKNVNFNLDPKVATIIAQIACHDNELPQGSPCSPVISNLIAHLLDMRMVKLAKAAKCTYSRYADDLTFSTNKKDFPEMIATKKNGSANEWLPGRDLKKGVKRSGFRINEAKTSLQYKTLRQIVTGLVVNKKVNIKKEYYKQARSMCSALFQTDEFYIDKRQISVPAIPENAKTCEVSPPESIENSLEASKSEEKETGSIKQLEGILSHIYQVKGRYDDRSIGDKRYKPTAVMKLYRKLLFYKHFFSLDRPLIICEGKTDPIYLKCALMQLEKEYGELVRKKDDGSFVFNIRFLSMSENLKDVLAIAPGTSGLAALMDIYKEYMRSFKGQGKKHPVIMLVDSDSGSKEIDKNLLMKVQGNPFYYFAENLYIVYVTPGISGEEKTIEDLFDAETLSTVIEGKTFNKKNIKIDLKTEYGKIIFAAKVVKANQNGINFNGFKDTLNRFKAVIENYDQKKPEQFTAKGKDVSSEPLLEAD